MEESTRFNNVDVWASQIMEGELKEAINLFIWRWGHPKLTLGEAEKLAVHFFDMLSFDSSLHNRAVPVSVEDFFRRGAK